MNALKVVLINSVIHAIEAKWGPMNGCIPYFVGLVRGSHLTEADIRSYKREYPKMISTCVDIVFAHFLNEEKGGEE